MSARQTNASEPLRTCRKAKVSSKPEFQIRPGRSSGEAFDRPSGDRHRGGVSLVEATVWNGEPRVDAKGALRTWRPHEGAEYRCTSQGRTARRSVDLRYAGASEGACHCSLRALVNQRWEEPMWLGEAVSRCRSSLVWRAYRPGESESGGGRGGVGNRWRNSRRI